MSKVKTKKTFVVYGYARDHEDKFGNYGTYYYIGKGTPRRPYNCSGRTIPCPRNKKRDIHIIYSNLDEKTALNLEIKLIKKYGRIDTDPEKGILRNMTDGGEGSSGYTHLENSKKKMSIGHKYRGEKKNWTHPVHGLVLNRTIRELMDLYPEQNLINTLLFRVANGKQTNHKGWIIVKRSLIDFNLTYQELNNTFGKKFAKQELKKFRQKSSKIRKKAANRRSIKFTWVHVKHGLVLNKTVTELIERFPEQKLLRTELNNIAKKENASYKGWITVNLNGDEKNVDKKELEMIYSKDYAITKVKEIRSKRKIKPRTWYHLERGFIKNKGMVELISAYPEDKLSKSGVSFLISGKLKQYKGWRLVGETFN